MRQELRRMENRLVIKISLMFAIALIIATYQILIWHLVRLK